MYPTNRRAWYYEDDTPFIWWRHKRFVVQCFRSRRKLNIDERRTPFMLITYGHTVTCFFFSIWNHIFFTYVIICYCGFICCEYLVINVYVCLSFNKIFVGLCLLFYFYLNMYIYCVWHFWMIHSFMDMCLCCFTFSFNCRYEDPEFSWK